MDLYISVSGKWYPEKKTKYGALRPGWICRSTNPEIETNRFPSYKDAFDAFLIILKDQWSETFENYPEISVSNPVLRGKSNRFTSDDDGFSMDLEIEEASISWTIALMKPKNRTLDEFIQVDERLKSAIQDIKDQGGEISVHLAGEVA